MLHNYSFAVSYGFGAGGFKSKVIVPVPPEEFIANEAPGITLPVFV